MSVTCGMDGRITGTGRSSARSTKVLIVAQANFFRPALEAVRPYEPGRPIESVQRELGLERVVKLASNEGSFGPFSAAVEAIERTAGDLNRYPDGGAERLRSALASKHDVDPANVALAAGADGVIGYLSLAALEPEDEVVCGWPSFLSYVLAAAKLGAIPRTVPLRGDRYDVVGILDAITARTKIVYLCNPNNPTGTMLTRAEVDHYFERVPPHVLTVLDEAYFEYIDEPEYPDGIDEYFKGDRRVLVLRTFSKIYGLAGLRVGYGVGPADVVSHITKVRNPFDINQTAQEAALVSLDDQEEVGRRRSANADGRNTVESALRNHGFRVVEHPVANFVCVHTQGDSQPVCDGFLREGVIVRPLAPFGAPDAFRVTVGTPDENAFFVASLSAVSQAVSVD